MSDINFNFLLKAQKIAKNKFGTTFPNPVVGCIIVKKGKIISKGVTAKEGRPHAEEIALKKAGDKARGATMYVTLEPCFHNSHNGSCAEQILRSGIKSVYIARHDPDPRTNNKSINKLIKNGVNTFTGQTANLTNQLNNFFFKSLINKRPFIKVKMAISKDQKIAWSNYNSKWISNSKSRALAHTLRNSSQAILTTGKTIMKDDPRLTVRKNNKIIKYLPTIIIDTSLKLSFSTKLLKDISKKRIIIFTSTSGKKVEYFKRLGCEVFILKKQKNNKLNLNLIFKKIFELKINDVLVESGGIFFTNLLKSNLVDELHLFTAPFVIGKSGKSILVNNKIENLNMREILNKKIGNNIYQQFDIL